MPATAACCRPADGGLRPRPGLVQTAAMTRACALNNNRNNASPPRVGD